MSKYLTRKGHIALSSKSAKQEKAATKSQKNEYNANHENIVRHGNNTYNARTSEQESTFALNRQVRDPRGAKSHRSTMLVMLGNT